MYVQKCNITVSCKHAEKADSVHDRNFNKNDREQKDHGKGNCVCVQRAEVLKRGAAGTPAGRFPVCLRDVSGHVHPIHTVHILSEGLFPQVCCRCGLMCVLT